MILYLKHNEIDKDRWDRCITKADNRKADVLSWYLDIVCPGWSALILDDYKTVMPLPLKRKFGIAYIYKPLFIQQLGLYGNTISDAILDSLLSKISHKIRLADIVLNESNNLVTSRYKVAENNNYILDIQNSYENIKKDYHRNCRRNIKKARLSGLKFSDSLSIDEFTGLLEPQIKQQLKSFGNEERNVFRLLITETLRKKAGEIVGVYDTNNNLTAAGFYLFSFERLLFKICGSTAAGKEDQAMYLLVDEQIKRHSGKYRFYDFQGSNIKGIAYFDSTFGAIQAKYYSLRLNNLPYLIRIISGKKNK